MTARTPPPLRCETCGKARKAVVGTCSHGNYEFWYCPETKKFLHDEHVRDKMMELTALVGCASHTSAPAPSGCDGCRKETEHLECPTPGKCDQMKCPICCEGSDFPTLPEEIKKYEAAAARQAREDVLKEATTRLQLILENPNKTLPWQVAPISQCIHLLESLRGHDHD